MWYIHCLWVNNTTISTNSRNSPKRNKNIGSCKELNTDVLSSFICCSPKLNRTHMYVSRSWVKLCYIHNSRTASLVAQTVKYLPAVWKTQVRSLGWEDPLVKELATHSSTLAWKIPWTKEPGRLQSMGSQRVGHDWVTSLYIVEYYFILQVPFYILYYDYLHYFAVRKEWNTDICNKMDKA